MRACDVPVWFHVLLRSTIAKPVTARVGASPESDAAWQGCQWYGAPRGPGKGARTPSAKRLERSEDRSRDVLTRARLPGQRAASVVACDLLLDSGGTSEILGTGPSILQRSLASDLSRGIVSLLPLTNSSTDSQTHAKVCLRLPSPDPCASSSSSGLASLEQAQCTVSCIARWCFVSLCGFADAGLGGRGQLKWLQHCFSVVMSAHRVLKTPQSGSKARASLFFDSSKDAGRILGRFTNRNRRLYI